MSLLSKITKYPSPKDFEGGIYSSSSKNGRKYVASEGRGLEKCASFFHFGLFKSPQWGSPEVRRGKNRTCCGLRASPL